MLGFARRAQFYRWLAAVFICVFLLVAAYFFITIRSFYTHPMPVPANMQSVKVYPHKGVKAVITDLQRQGLLKNSHVLHIWLRIVRPAARVVVGEYRLTAGITPMQLLAKMQSGKVWVHKVRFIEGWTWQDCWRALQQARSLQHIAYQPLISSIEAKTASHNTNNTNLEGLLAPSTYFYQWPTTNVAIVARAYKHMQKILQQAWQQRAAGLSYKNPYQALIVASLIERETALAKERSMIAAVILNRLRLRMRLQVDPTVNYGLGIPYGQALTKSDLRSDTPYNTYRKYGLPPTPIGMPSQASIVAALQPAKVDFLYYVARKDGSHSFSKTYMGHLRAKQQNYPLSSIEQRYYDAHIAAARKQQQKYKS